eukprot:362589-Chlamydomonas_euryale.AAC.1
MAPDVRTPQLLQASNATPPGGSVGPGPPCRGCRWLRCRCDTARPSLLLSFPASGFSKPACVAGTSAARPQPATSHSSVQTPTSMRHGSHPPSARLATAARLSDRPASPQHRSASRVEPPGRGRSAGGRTAAAALAAQASQPSTLIR